MLEQLVDLGLLPSDIDLLILTHFNMDQAGNHDAFVNLQFLPELLRGHRLYDAVVIIGILDCVVGKWIGKKPFDKRIV